MMRLLLHVALWPITLLMLAACRLDLPSYNPQGYRLYESGRGGFSFDVRPDKFRDLGGARSPEMIRLMESELSKEALCPRGYIILSDGGGKGNYYIYGRCKEE